MEIFRPDSVLVAQVRPSPNCNERRGGGVAARQPDMLVLHYTGLKPDDDENWRKDPGGCALDWLCNPAAQVSAHYLVETDGRIIQMVPETLRAWHAGASCWQGESDLNSASIGVEIVNLGHPGGLPDFPQAQIAAVTGLCRDICQRWNIAPARVLGHSDIAPGRKDDPGEKFPWERLFHAGIGLWPGVATPPADGGPVLQQGAQGAAVRQLRRNLQAYGYELPVAEVYDTQTADVVLAFQRHFRPALCDGAADEQTCAILRELLRLKPGPAGA